MGHSPNLFTDPNIKEKNSLAMPDPSPLNFIVVLMYNASYYI